MFIFTSDHGDMLGSHGQRKKQKPWDEAILVPLVVRCPAAPKPGRVIDAPIATPDLMPTLLGLCGAPVPESVEGADRSAWIAGAESPPGDGAALIACYTPYGEWSREKGGREYRGVCARRATPTSATSKARGCCTTTRKTPIN